MGCLTVSFGDKGIVGVERGRPVTAQDLTTLGSPLSLPFLFTLVGGVLSWHIVSVPRIVLDCRLAFDGRLVMYRDGPRCGGAFFDVAWSVSKRGGTTHTHHRLRTRIEKRTSSTPSGCPNSVKIHILSVAGNLDRCAKTLENKTITMDYIPASRLSEVGRRCYHPDVLCSPCSPLFPSSPGLLPLFTLFPPALVTSNLHARLTDPQVGHWSMLGTDPFVLEANGLICLALLMCVLQTQGLLLALVTVDGKNDVVR